MSNMNGAPACQALHMQQQDAKYEIILVNVKVPACTMMAYGGGGGRVEVEPLHFKPCH